jgi:cell division septation protein DedD
MTSKKSGSDTRGKGAGKIKAAPRAPVKRAWLRVAGILFLAVWMFVLGVLVGRGTAPVRFDIQKLQKELAALKAAALKRSEPAKAALSGSTPSGGGIDPADLGFYEDLRSSRSHLNFKPAVQQKARKKSPEPAARPAKKPQPTAAAAKKNIAVKPATAKNVAKTRSREKPATDRQVAKARPAPSKKSTARRQVTIQVASVKSQQVADRMVRDLKKKGYPAYARIGKVPGKGIWYRIRVGRFASRQDAAGMQARLRRDKWEAVIVSR